MRADRCYVEVGREVRAVGKLREQDKKRRALVEDRLFFEPSSEVEPQLGAVQNPSRFETGQIVRERDPRRGLNSKNSVIFNSNPRSGVKPVPKIACELTDVAEILPVGRRLGSGETGEAARLPVTQRKQT